MSEDNKNEMPFDETGASGADESASKQGKKSKKEHKKDDLSAALEDKINAQSKEIEELKDKYLRLYSEFDNFRKRNQKEKVDLIRTASEDVIRSLLPVMDDFERALKAMNSLDDKGQGSFSEGLQLIYNKFRSLLEQRGLEPIVSVGEKFDVDFHDALTVIPVDDAKQKDIVIEEIEKGYKLNGKVIRHARVVVGN